ncbi:MAG: DUF4373 domain-containing protein [Sphingobacteriales bacterium]|nr:MAG: DUF4373 domain-containing protein [Sphingobacteriales bacterium]
MRKQTNFHHPVDTYRDDRFADLIAAHGHAGYGIYWMIIEMLHSQETMQIEYSDKAIRRMAARIGMKQEQFHHLLHDMIYDYDLLEIVDNVPSMGKQGYIRSTITYRKPPKPKAKAETIEVKKTEDTNIGDPLTCEEVMQYVADMEDDGLSPSTGLPAVRDHNNGNDTSAVRQPRQRLEAVG